MRCEGVKEGGRKEEEAVGGGGRSEEEESLLGSVDGGFRTRLRYSERLI